MTSPNIPEEYRGGSSIDAAAMDALNERRNAIVGTQNKDGTVHMTPVWFLYEDGLFFFETNSATRKARNVAERSVVTMLIPGAKVDVIAMGDGRVIGGEESAKINRRLRAKYLTPEGEGPVGSFFERLDDVSVELKPRRVTTWTNDKLRQSMRDIPGYTPEAAATWFKESDG